MEELGQAGGRFPWAGAEEYPSMGEGPPCWKDALTSWEEGSTCGEEELASWEGVHKMGGGFDEPGGTFYMLGWVTWQVGGEGLAFVMDFASREEGSTQGGVGPYQVGKECTSWKEDLASQVEELLCWERDLAIREEGHPVWEEGSTNMGERVGS